MQITEKINDYTFLNSIFDKALVGTLEAKKEDLIVYCFETILEVIEEKKLCRPGAVPYDFYKEKILPLFVENKICIIIQGIK